MLGVVLDRRGLAALAMTDDKITSPFGLAMTNDEIASAFGLAVASCLMEAAHGEFPPQPEVTDRLETLAEVSPCNASLARVSFHMIVTV